MTNPFSQDTILRIQAFITNGHYKTEEEVVRDALSALEHRQDDLLAIQAGITDMEAGRFRSFSEIDKEFRAKLHIPKES